MITKPHNIGAALVVQYETKHKNLYIGTEGAPKHFVMGMDVFNNLLKFMEEQLDKEDGV